MMQDQKLTDDDGDWVAETLSDIAPIEGIPREWINEGVKDHNSHAVNRYRQKGTNLIVMVAVNPIKLTDTYEKKVSYHVIVCREDNGKMSKPNAADITRARNAFFLRPFTHEEKVHEGTMGDSSAHHIVGMIAASDGAKIANPNGGFF